MLSVLTAAAVMGNAEILILAYASGHGSLMTVHNVSMFN